MHTTSPSITRVLIIGTGLIGTSIGLSLSQQGCSVGLCDASAEHLKQAVKQGGGHPHASGDTYDLAIIATPPRFVADHVETVLKNGTAPLVTDVASAKNDIIRAVRAKGIDPAHYIPSHPMAGRETAGPLAAAAGLFEHKAWAVSPLPGTDQAALTSLETLIRLCGAIPVAVELSRHDTFVAAVSHLPHLISTILAATAASDPRALQLTGTGLPDMIRLAGGHPDLWTDIITGNHTAATQQLQHFRLQLDLMIQAIEKAAAGDPGNLHTTLQAGVLGREAVEAAIRVRLFGEKKGE